MTGIFGGLLYTLALLIAVWFVLQVRRQSFTEILDRRAEEHHRVTAVLAQHPHGGSWREYRRWEELAGDGGPDH